MVGPDDDVLRLAEEARLDPPAQAGPEDVSNHCWNGYHFACDWDNVGACKCECHVEPDK